MVNTISRMQVVKFKKPYTPYKEGDIAGVTDEAFGVLAKEGFVEIYEQEQKKEQQDEEQKQKSVDEPEENKMLKTAPVKK